MRKYLARFLRWWYREERVQLAMWALYDFMEVKDVPPPPFPKPQIPQWVREVTKY